MMSQDQVYNGTETRYEVSGFAIEKTVKLMKLTFGRILFFHPELDITVDQWIIIQLLTKHKQLSQQELADLSSKDAPTITRILDLLVSKALIERTPSLTDRRKFTIKLTPKGLITNAKVEPLLHSFREEAYNGISDHELQLLESITQKIFANLSKSN